MEEFIHLTSEEQLNWLKQQVEFMRAWVRELQSKQEPEPGEVDRVAAHLTWLIDSISQINDRRH